MIISVMETDNGSGMTIHIIGSVGEKEFMNFVKSLLMKNRIKGVRYRYCIASFADANHANFSTNSLYRLVDWCQEAAVHNPDMRIAIIASQDLTFGLARMWEFFMTECPWKIGVFRRLLEARHWINATGHDPFVWPTSDIHDSPSPTDETPVDRIAERCRPSGNETSSSIHLRCTKVFEK